MASAALLPALGLGSAPSLLLSVYAPNEIAPLADIMVADQPCCGSLDRLVLDLGLGVRKGLECTVESEVCQRSLRGCAQAMRSIRSALHRSIGELGPTPVSPIFIDSSSSF